MLRAVRSPEIDEFVDVILNPRFTQHRVGYQGSSHAPDRKAVRSPSPINVVGGLPSSPGCHILDNDSGVSGDVFTQDRSDGSGPHVRRATRRAAQNNRNRFVLIKRCLAQHNVSAKSEIDKRNEENRSHFLLLVPANPTGRSFNASYRIADRCLASNGRLKLFTNTPFTKA